MKVFDVTVELKFRAVLRMQAENESDIPELVSNLQAEQIIEQEIVDNQAKEFQARMIKAESVPVRKVEI